MQLATIITASLTFSELQSSTKELHIRGPLKFEGLQGPAQQLSCSGIYVASVSTAIDTEFHPCIAASVWSQMQHIPE